jgi:hypothetical protein
MGILMIYIFVDVGRYWQQLSEPAAIYRRYYPKPFEYKLPVRAYIEHLRVANRKQGHHSFFVFPF